MKNKIGCAEKGCARGHREVFLEWITVIETFHIVEQQISQIIANSGWKCLLNHKISRSTMTLCKNFKQEFSFKIPSKLMAMTTTQSAPLNAGQVVERTIKISYKLEAIIATILSCSRSDELEKVGGHRQQFQNDTISAYSPLSSGLFTEPIWAFCWRVVLRKAQYYVIIYFWIFTFCDKPFPPHSYCGSFYCNFDTTAKSSLGPMLKSKPNLAYGYNPWRL